MRASFPEEEMPEAIVTPYGEWKSPISSEAIVAETIRLMEVVLDGEDIYWIESRPLEGGRNVVVRRDPTGKKIDLNAAPLNVRTRVHEYGGGALLVANGVLFFSNFDDNRLYRQEPGAAAQPITPAGAYRYADMILDGRRNRIICVREDHIPAECEAINAIVSLDLAEHDGGRVLVSGNDFYAAPRLNPAGTQLAWLTWNHPNMPWDGTELWVVEVATDGSLGEPELVAGGRTESIFQPEWSPDGALYFVSDRSGWWNLYRWRQGSVESVTEMEAEFGKPQWVFGMSTYAFESQDQVICTYCCQGNWHLASLDTRTCQLEPSETPYTYFGDICAAPGFAVFQAASPTESKAIVRLDLGAKQFETLRRSSEMVVNPDYISLPQSIEFPTEHGLTAHAFFYPPKNGDHCAPPGELPPLLVVSHGGPTGATDSTLDLRFQYWTSRGFAVVDVNYGGSTGYGRAYRERLNGQWGVVDVDDCCNAARYLIEQGLVDSERVIIRGGSAGGYTTLCALTFRDLFQAGASYYGVGDLDVLAGETHKFESRYLDQLVGPYPERADLYYARSAINFTDRLSCPVIFFQGLEDKVVPPNQAESMVAALETKGIPVAYLPFEGENHGFRRAENIKRALDAELYFYGRVLNFEPADPIEPVQIANLD
jgi:dipeptidyl aminopeptidase/acylaminoacyl peptidase